ncbi:MAG: DNA polymerase III subunit gamma/tau [Candidatus Omnitrophica bacterium]|nr:DNA polymerase III subunit gamma/tau [Candidatus Omnitrophota bacterium]
MSYVVFALKWRPKNFDEIIGQKYIVTTLKNALEQNRLGHAYLFSGPRGVGKTSTARILAKSLNCKEGPTLNPCQTCASCIEISQGRSMDVIEIDGASNRGIDEIRTLRENVKFSPTQGKYKVYIIDEVHQITPDGFNALLKTLEEPPAFVKFIFATTQPNKVIPTILSRCQRLDFRRITVMEIIGQLERIVAAEKIEVEKEVLVAIAKSSDGSLRDAESILDQLISFSKDKLSLKDIVSMLGIVEQEMLFEITEKIIQKDAKAALTMFSEIISQGKDIGVLLLNFIEHFRNLMIAKITHADSQLIDLPVEICQRLAEQSQAFSLEEIFSAFNTLINTQEISKRLDSLRIPLEITLVKLAHDKRDSNQNLPLSKGSYVTKHASPIKEKHTEQPAEKEDNPVTLGPVQSASLDNLKSVWKNIIDNLAKIKMSVATYLDEGEPTKLENNILTISFPLNYSLHKESLERKENKAIIEKTASELLNTDIKVNFTLSKETVKKDNSEADPFIKSVLQTFNGRVVKGQ